MLEETIKTEFNNLCVAEKCLDVVRGLKQYGMQEEAKDLLKQFNTYLTRIDEQYKTREVGVKFKEEMLKHWYEDNVKKYEIHLNYNGA
jgi:hypothetical protein